MLDIFLRIFIHSNFPISGENRELQGGQAGQLQRHQREIRIKLSKNPHKCSVAEPAHFKPGAKMNISISKTTLLVNNEKYCK